MGYILKKGTGGGGVGDATAANQTTQINQLENVSNQVVFKEGTQESVFTYGASYDSVLKYNIANYPSFSSTKCIGFTAANVSALGALIQSFLGTGNFYINSICYAINGVSHSALVTYTQI